MSDATINLSQLETVRCWTVERCLNWLGWPMDVASTSATCAANGQIVVADLYHGLACRENPNSNRGHHVDRDAVYSNGRVIKMSSLHAWANVVTLETLAATVNRTCHTRRNNGHVLALFQAQATPFHAVSSLFVLFLFVPSLCVPFLVALFHAAHVHVAHAHVVRVPSHVAHAHVLVLALAPSLFRARVLFLAIGVPVQQSGRPSLVATDPVDLATATIVELRTCAMDSHNIDAVECGEHQSSGKLILGRGIQHIAMRSD